jgi:hypothetical protein
MSLDLIFKFDETYRSQKRNIFDDAHEEYKDIERKNNNEL